MIKCTKLRRPVDRTKNGINVNKGKESIMFSLQLIFPFAIILLINKNALIVLTLIANKFLYLIALENLKAPLSKA